MRDASDGESWREFDERYGALIVAFCRKSGLQPADADDVRQIVLVSLAKAMPRFEYQPERGRFRDFLFTVVKNAIRRARERQVRTSEPLLLDVTQLEIEVDDPALARWNEEWTRQHFLVAMAHVRETLEPKSVAIFERLLAGADAAAVAAEHGVSLDVVYKVKQRVRDRLRERIEQQLRDEDMVDDPRSS